jgi:hypothetical protein
MCGLAKRGRFAYTGLPAAHFDRNERCAYFGDRSLMYRPHMRADHRSAPKISALEALTGVDPGLT